MNQTNIATAADYADAMITARRTKGWLFIILLLLLLIQVTVFFLAAYTDLILVTPSQAEAPAVVEGEAAAEVTVAAAPAQTRLGDFMQYLNVLIAFLGLTLAVVLSVVLLILVFIMLVGRLIGVSRMTSAWIWSILLVVILFPLQSLLVSPVTVPPVEEIAAIDRYEFKFPGVLYTWTELASHARFMHREAPIAEQILKWVRFVAYPVLAMIILLMIQVKSNRGLRMALGEDEAPALPPPSETYGDVPR
jgi:hypothetical protein